MHERHLDYPQMIAEALRGVARQALEQVSMEGLPGDHHFYLSFRTRADGVRVPPFLRDQYPDEMTVVLQNQFWDLVVDDEAFSVTLTFGGKRHSIYVPFSALTAFTDPTAQVGLRFEPLTEDGEGDGDEADGEELEASEANRFEAGWDGEEGEEGDESDEGPDEPDPGTPARVVSIDRFRKKD